MNSAGSPAKPKKRRCHVWVDPDVCDGCGVCVYFCKPKVLVAGRELTRRGVYPVVAVHVQDCTLCGLCELGCPQFAIWVEETTLMQEEP